MKEQEIFANLLLYKHLWQQFKFQVFLGKSLQFWTPVFGQFIPFFPADHLKLCQIQWEASKLPS